MHADTIGESLTRGLSTVRSSTKLCLFFVLIRSFQASESAHTAAVLNMCLRKDASEDLMSFTNLIPMFYTRDTRSRSSTPLHDLALPLISPRLIVRWFIRQEACG